MERHEMQRQLIVQGATRLKQNKEDTSFLQNHTRAALHVSQEQNKRDEMETYTHKSRKHWDQTHHFTQTAGHVTTKWKVIKFNL